MSIRYTPWADPLLDYINSDLAASTGGASSPFAPINYNADLFANEAKFFTGNFGFDGIHSFSPAWKETAIMQRARQQTFS